MHAPASVSERSGCSAAWPAHASVGLYNLSRSDKPVLLILFCLFPMTCEFNVFLRAYWPFYFSSLSSCQFLMRLFEFFLLSCRSSLHILQISVAIRTLRCMYIYAHTHTRIYIRRFVYSHIHRVVPCLWLAFHLKSGVEGFNFHEVHLSILSFLVSAFCVLSKKSVCPNAEKFLLLEVLYNQLFFLHL